MACCAEHWFTLDFALNHASWTSGRFEYAGWQTGAEDPFNHMEIYPDEICDWLYQKAPYGTHTKM